MRALLFVTFAAVGTWTASAWAQFGLYGSPEMVNLPQAELTMLPEPGSPATPASYSSPWRARPAPNQPVYSATPQPAVQRPAYTPVAQPVAQPSYPATSPSAYGAATAPQAAPQPAYVPPQAPPQTRAQTTYVPPQTTYVPPQRPQQTQPQATYIPPQRPYIPAQRRPVAQVPYGRSVQQAPPQPTYVRPNPAYGTPTRPKGAGAPAMPAVPEAPLHPQPRPTPNVIDQMLAEPGCQEGGVYGGGGVYGACGTDGSPMAEAIYGDGAAAGCCPWFASVAGLALSRNEPNRFYWSANAADASEQDGLVYQSWSGGVEVRFGRRFCCSAEGSCLAGTWALEGAYWTVINGFEGERVVRFPGGVVTPIMLNSVQFYNTVADQPMATDIIDGAVEHRIRRRDEIHSVEINLIREGMLCDPCNPLDVNWGIGVRYFRFDERVLFAALHGGSWGADPTEEAYINIRDENNLIGLQFTVDLNYYLHPNWRVFFTPRVGIYENHIEQNFQVYRGDGVVGRSTDPNVPGRFPIRSRGDAVSFLTQLDVGVNWRFARNWGAAIGYRAVVATGIGLADNQVPPWLVDLPEIAHIDYNGELILHGAFASVTYNF